MTAAAQHKGICCCLATNGPGSQTNKVQTRCLKTKTKQKNPTHDVNRYHSTAEQVDSITLCG